MEKSWDRRSPWLATGLYAALVAALAYHHEMWRDEVRALSVAVRNPSWSSLFFELRHEGHPLLWYAVLRTGYALTHSNLVLPIVAAVIGVMTAWLIMKYAPFPLWLRLLSVFGSFLVYELTVVARNYGIGVLLMVCSCIAFRHRSTRPFILAVCLALMANTSVHAALAALILLSAWMFDLLDAHDRRALLSLQGILSVVLVAVAIVFALWTARPTPDMAWALSASTLNTKEVIRTIFTDPGVTLGGGGDLGAVGELPWPMLHPSIDFPRVIIDAAVVWLLWKFRNDWKALLLVVATAIAFGVFFRNVYSGSARHEALLLFLIFSIAWMSTLRNPSMGRSFALGVLPLFAFQTLALPVIAKRYLTRRESNSKAYAAFIRSKPEFSNAILMSEPDYLMEALPYYVDNRIYMPRQREFHWRVYFDKGEKRARVMSLGTLHSIADSVSCASKAPVLLAIGDRHFEYQSSGFDRPSYNALFTWSAPEWRAFRASSRFIARFPYASSDEIYRVFEITCQGGVS